MTCIICPYFKRCGGCLYQDMPHEAYLEMKQRFIRRAFADKGLFPEIAEVREVPLGSRRRASFAFKNGLLGFNQQKSHALVDIEECLILTPALVAFLPALKAFIRPLKGAGDVFVQETPFGLDVHIHHGKERPTLAFLEDAAAFCHAHPVARLLYNQTPILEKTKLPFPPDAFLQPSEAGERLLIQLMLTYVGEAKTALDLFCGAGTFTRPLLEKGLKVHGYDCVAESVAVLGNNGSVRDLFRAPLLPTEFEGIDVAVMDPPRAGAKAQSEEIARSSLKRLILISCNPITAARDAKILTDAGFKMGEVVPVDQFTFSNHIELVCLFTK